MTDVPRIVPVYRPYTRLTASCKKTRQVEVEGRPWVRTWSEVELVEAKPGGHLMEVKFPDSEDTDLIPIDEWNLELRKTRRRIEL